MPRAPKQCGHHGCPERVVGRPYCDQHTAEQQARTGWGRGSTRQSRRERAIVLTRDPACYLQYPGCTHHATEDDHVIPKHLGGTDDLANRRGACSHCHAIKSRHEAAEAKRRAGTPSTPF